ncbi:MAG TPA: alpha/beta hydrolase [Longimicrobiaceae bacterium]|jgi:pimeloyl-ACP methyl ester carboxylesterase
MSTTIDMGAAGRSATATDTDPEGRPTIVLVHGAWADGSGWQGVHRLLRRDGYEVRVVQHPTISLADDAAATRRVMDDVGGDVLLVGHSYGGAVITEAGNDPRVVGLVYVAGWALDDGESIAALIADPPPGATLPPILPPRDGFLLLDRARFPAAFAADVPEETARFMADAQLPWGLGAFQGTVGSAAWRSKPSWYLLTRDDLMIPPPLQRTMAGRAGARVVEEAGSHAVYVSRPEVVAGLVAAAVGELRTAGAR